MCTHAHITHTVYEHTQLLSSLKTLHQKKGKRRIIKNYFSLHSKSVSEIKGVNLPGGSLVQSSLHTGKFSGAHSTKRNRQNSVQ